VGKKIALFAFCVLCITFTLIGCGGGGGGGGVTSNPVGPVAVTGPVADLSGTVKLSTGEILGNAPVEIYRSEMALQTGIPGLSALRGSVLAQTTLAEGKYSTKTDASGVYRFTGIPVGEYTLVANAGGASQFAQTGILLGSVTSVDAQLTPTGKASGKLLLVSGDPARGVVVHLAKTSYVAISDFNGEFVFDQIPSGQTFTLSVLPLQGVLQNPLTVSVAPAENKQLGNLILTVPAAPTQAFSTVSGSVVAADSSVPTAVLGSKLVVAQPAGQNLIENIALTDASGRFSLNVKSVGNYNVSVVGGEFAVAPTVQTVTVSALGTTVTVPQAFVLAKPTVVLPPTTQFYTYSGTISKRSKAFNEPDNAGVPLTLTSTDAAANVFSAVTSPTGSFTFSIPAGTYNLAVGGGYAFETAFAGNPVTINAPTVLNTVIWVVPTQVFTASYLIEGSINKVIKKTGEFNNGDVTVTIRSDSATFKPQTTVTEATGKFTFKVPAGNYALEVGSGYVFVTPPSGFPYAITTADLILASPLDVRPAGVVPASIGGNVTPPRPNNPYRVRIEKTDGTYTDNETTASAFYFNNLPSGEYRVVVLPDANGYYIESGLLNVVEGQNLGGISLAPTPVAPMISTISATEDVLTVIGNNFQSLPVDPAFTKILVDGNPRARPTAFTPTDVQEQAMIVSVTPGQHNVVIEKQWTRPNTSEVFLLKSNPVSFNKGMGSPTDVTKTDVTDTSARISWTNANFTSKSIVEVYQVSNNSQVASVVLDGTSFQVAGLLPTTDYVAHVYNRYGDIKSAPTTVNFNTRSPGLNAASSVVLANSASFLDLDSTNMAIFGFEMMNDNIYVAYASSSNEVFVKSYSSNGAELNSWQVSASFGETTSRVSMCSGDNKIFVTYPDNQTTPVQKMVALDENLAVIGSVFSFDSLVSDVNQIKIEYHGGRVYAALTYYFPVTPPTNDNRLYLYAFNNDLTSPTLVYSAQNTFSPDTYFIQTAADEVSGDLYVAVSSGSANLHDSTEVIKKSLANPTLPGTTLGFVHFTSTPETITEFHVYGNDLITNGNFGYVKMSRSSGLATSLTNFSNGLSSFGVDASGRLWSFMSESNGSKYLVNHENNSVARSLKIAEFPITYSDFQSVVFFREFIKLQNDGKFGMLYVNNSNELAVYRYNSSF